jgi:hypothetical protein
VETDPASLPDVPIALFGWVIDGTFALALVAAAISLATLIVTSVLGSRQAARSHAFDRYTSALTLITGKNRLLQKQGLQVLREMAKSRWVTRSDKSNAEVAIADYVDDLKAKLSKAKGAK